MKLPLVTKSRTRRLCLFGLFVLFLLASASIYTAVWYHRFYNHITVQELSHDVNHSTFQASMRDGSSITLHLYQQANASAQPLVVFTSGDGGWSPFCADIAAHIASSGKTVVGFNMKDYLVNFSSPKKPVSPEEITRDYDDIIKASLDQRHVNRQIGVTLVGWSAGAGFSVAAASDPSLRPQVDRVVAISLPIYSELAWRPSDAIIYFTHGTPREKLFDSRQYLTRLGSTPIAMLSATDDDDSPFRVSQSLFAMVSGPKHFYAIKARGHRFEGGESDFYRALDEELSSVHL